MGKKHKYLIALLPPEPVAGEITGIKKDFAENYNSAHALKSPSHITLQKPFVRDEDYEPVLDNFLQDFSKKFSPFHTELSGFGHFDDRVIFVNVMENKILADIFKTLREELKNILKFDEKELDIHFHPHLTVAHRDLNRSSFKIAWNNYKEKKFEAAFVINDIALLKHNFKFWEVLKQFQFSSY